jgi:hypothetical protein
MQEIKGKGQREEVAEAANSVGAFGGGNRVSIVRPCPAAGFCTMRPSASMTALIPVGVERITGRPLLDRAQPRLRQMLRRAPTAEPGIVRGVEDEIGAVGAVGHLPRKDDFIADLHTDFDALAIEGQVERARSRGPARNRSPPAPAALRPAVRAASAAPDIRHKAPDAPCHTAPVSASGTRISGRARFHCRCAASHSPPATSRISPDRP